MHFSIDLSFKSKEKRSNTFPEDSLNSFMKWLENGGFGQKTASGEMVDEESALKMSAVWACVRILSETIAALPLHIYRKEGNNKFIADDHKLYPLLHDAPNDLMTSFIWRESSMSHLSLWGNSYSRIIRNGGMIPQSFELLQPADITPQIVGGKIVYKIRNVKATIPAIDMIHFPGLSFDGITGKSPIEVAAENIGLGLALQRFGSEFFLNGAMLSGTLEHPGKLSDPAYKHLSESFTEKNVGQGKRFKPQILEEGMKWVSQTMPLEAAQFILSRNFQLNEIARIFRIPPHMLADLTRSTNNNIEHQGMEVVQYTFLPWCVRMEQELNRKIFKESEKGKVYAKFNLMGLLRGDSASRASYYSSRFNIGTLSQNEIRELEDQNSIGPEGDKYYVQLNMATGDSNTADPLNTNLNPNEGNQDDTKQI